MSGDSTTGRGEASGGGAWAAYRRLAAYARRYWVRLALGIGAGFLVGGSLFGLLSAAPLLFRPFESAPAGLHAPSADAESAAPARPPADLLGKQDQFVRMAQRYGIPTTGPDGRMTWQLMLLTLLAVPLLAIAKGATTFLNRYYTHWVGSAVVRDLRNDLFERLQAQSLKFFGKSDVGSLISQCVNDVSVVETVFATTISDATRAPMEILAAIVFVIQFSISHQLGWLVGVVFVVFPLCVLPVIVMGRWVRRYMHSALQRVSGLVTCMHENFTCIRVVKAFHTEEQEARRFRQMNQSYFRAVIRGLRAEELMTPLMEMVALVLGLMFFLACYARGVRLFQIIPVGLAAVVAYRPIKQLARINAATQRGAAALSRVFALLDADDILRESSNSVVVRAFRDRIVFDRVTFAYRAGDAPLLRAVSLEFPAGSVLAVVGESGAGKTTLANLLARFYDPTGGRVLLDGTDLREIETASLRRLISVVTQETILFNDTIAANIAYGSENAPRAAIEDAARQANAHDFIAAHPAGYDRVVGEKGFVLSGGERQRIALARAILRNAPILILDEATSALDTVTERLVQGAIARAMQGRSVFAIAHRLSTVRHASQIILVDQGGIAERGTHDELYRTGGHYRRLCDMQMLEP